MQELLEQEPEGIRYSVFVKKLGEALPDIPPNTIHGTIWNAEAKHPDIFYKPVKGLFRLTKFKDDQFPLAPIAAQPKPKEEHFYAAFAEYLVKELEERSKAIPLGGNKFRDKWGTPDVIGVLKPRPTDIFNFQRKSFQWRLSLISPVLLPLSDRHGLTSFSPTSLISWFRHRRPKPTFRG
jgi:hypothetical protein